MPGSGFAALDQMIDRMKKLGAEEVAARVASKAAPLVDKAIKATASAGQTPDGKTWQPKKDGGKPLVNAAAHIKTFPIGRLIVVTLLGPTAIHDKGLGGSPQRKVLPFNGQITPRIAQALLEGARQVFNEITGAD